MEVITSISTILSSLLTLATGLAYVFNLLENLSTNGNLGLLYWSEEFTIQDTNVNWRAVFSLSPSTFFVNWFPVLCSLASVVSHFQGFENSAFKSWGRVSLWYAFLGAFCALPYSGNLGIIAGFSCALSFVLCFLMFFFSKGGTVSSFKISSNGGCGGGGNGSGCADLTKMFSLLASLASIGVGGIHAFYNGTGFACRDVAGVTCIGPALVWIDDMDYFTVPINLLTWGLAFSLNPNIFFPLWGPFFISLLAFLQHLPSQNVKNITNSWGMTCVFYLFIAVFCNFGYAGNFGVITGFLTSFTAFLCFITLCLGGNGSGTAVLAVKN